MNAYVSRKLQYFNTTAPMSIKLRSFQPIQPFWTNSNYFSLTAATFQSSCSCFKSCCCYLELPACISSEATTSSQLQLFLSVCTRFWCQIQYFPAKCTCGWENLTWIISIWLQFKCTYFKPTATISILLHLFWANVSRIETLWFFHVSS